MQQSKKWLALIGTGIAAIIVAIDFTIVNTCLPKIQHDLSATVNQLQWVFASYGLTFCTLLVTMGRIGDIVGRRKLLYVGMFGFGIFSLGAGLAHSPQLLITMRLLQGIFSSAIFPAGMAITADAFPEKERGRALGMYGSILGIGLAIGPVLGSILVTLLNWRWIFFVNIPIIISSYLICFAAVRESKLTQRIPIDWLGVFFIIGFLGALVFAINEGGVYGWISPLIIGCFIFSFICLLALIFVEKKIKDPLLPVPLFMNANFLLALLVYIDSISFAWPIIFIMPLYLSNVLGFSVAIVGLIIATMTIMTVIGPLVAGYLYDRKSKAVSVHLTFVISIISLILFLMMGVNGPLVIVILSFILFGFAWGMGNGISLPLALSQAGSAENAGFIAGALTTAMNVIAVILLALFTTIFRYKENSTLFNSLTKNNVMLNSVQMEQVRSLLSNPEKAKTILSGFTQNISGDILALFHSSFVIGMRYAIGLLLILAIIFWIFSIGIMRRKTPR